MRDQALLEKQSQCIEKNVSAACSAVAGMQGGATTPGLSQPVGPLATTATVNPAVTSGPVLKDSKGKSLATRTQGLANCREPLVELLEWPEAWVIP